MFGQRMKLALLCSISCVHSTNACENLLHTSLEPGSSSVICFYLHKTIFRSLSLLLAGFKRDSEEIFKIGLYPNIL